MEMSARTSALCKRLHVFLEPFFGFPDCNKQIRVEHRGSHKHGRTGSVTEALYGGLGMARQVDFQDLPPQLVQVHVVDRILGILRRGERDESEPTVFCAWGVAGSARSEEGDG